MPFFNFHKLSSYTFKIYRLKAVRVNPVGQNYFPVIAENRRRIKFNAAAFKTEFLRLKKTVLVIPVCDNDRLFNANRANSVVIS